MSSTRSGEGGAAAATLRSFLSRDSLIVGVALAAAAILAWAWLASRPMAGMEPEPFSAAYLVPAYTMWAIMMVAMMIPSAAPMILLHSTIDKAPSARARTAHTLLFAFAYLLVWAAFSAAAAFAQAILVASNVVSAMSLSLGNRTMAAGLLIVAAAYELTAIKQACLDKCQSPLMFMLKHYRPGAAGALRLGLVPGLYCLGCCWVLMLLLFVGGVMNLAWVALLGIVVLGQKFAPPSWHAHRFVAGGLLASAVLLLIR